MSETYGTGGVAPSSVGDILSGEQLQALRESYSNERMNQIARTGVSGSFTPAAHLHQVLTDLFFHGLQEVDANARVGPSAAVPTPLSAREREIIIISMMTARLADPVFLAIHIYWGLMEGLSPEEIAWVQHLSGLYSGIDKFSRGIRVLTDTLRALQSCSSATDVDTVVRELAKQVQ